MNLRCIGVAILTTLLVSLPVRAESDAVVTVDTNTPGAVIPDDFSGLSFETKLLLPDQHGKHLFSADNKLLIALFHQLGIHNLRIGGNTADNSAVSVPGETDIDNLFAFAHAAGARVIYTLRLKQSPDPADAAKIAAYVMSHYRSDVACLAIGNEPNVYEKEYEPYRDLMKKYFDAITTAAPDAKFCGPSNTGGKIEWTREFAADFGPGGKLAMVTQHAYPGGSARKVTDPAAARDRLLSPEIYKSYESMRKTLANATSTDDLPYRLEEANSYFYGGAKDVSNTLASALWALDYLHWWALHGAAGMNYHTGDSVAAGNGSAPCYYATYWSSADGYEVHPIGYALKAFDLGGHGRVVATAIASPGSLNITAYALCADKDGLFVTLINKEHRPVTVSLNVSGDYTRGRSMELTSTGGDMAATNGLTLGGAAIKDDASWNGSWAPMPPPADGRNWTVNLPQASAAIVNLTPN